ncbi:MAG TPA: response regulator, partial [Phycisphaerae bacterium]|nr:response regulator [Phycisphaerae bacterium]
MGVRQPDPIATVLSKALDVQTSATALIVDDDPVMRKVCRRYLEAEGWNVFEAANGREALGCFCACNPDVVMVDLDMPEMDGLETTRCLRNDPLGESVPIVMLSSEENHEALLDGLEAGADVYIAKPIREREFTLRVRSLSRLQRARRSMEAGRAILGEQTRALSLLLDFSMALAMKEDLDSILKRTIEVAAELTSCQRVSIMMPDAAGTVLTIAASHGISEHVVQHVRTPIGKSIAGRVFQSGDPILINSQDEAEAVLESQDVRVFEGLPLLSTAMRAPEKIVAVLNVTGRIGSRPFDVSELGFLNLLTNFAASAIQNVRSRQARDEARDSIVVALAKLAEHRDDDTGTHLDRVTQYCLTLARELRRSPVHVEQIDREFMRNLERSAPLHDIGKVAIPDAILLKPGRLNDEEMAVMRTHARIGADTIRSLLERTPDSAFLQMAEMIAENHHEWFNGCGYPSGKSGTEIPLSAR